MMIKNVCMNCGGEIEKDRKAILDTDLCAKCASNVKWNILEPHRTEVVDVNVEKVFPNTSKPET